MSIKASSLSTRACAACRTRLLNAFVAGLTANGSTLVAAQRTSSNPRADDSAQTLQARHQSRRKHYALSRHGLIRTLASNPNLLPQVQRSGFATAVTFSNARSQEDRSTGYDHLVAASDTAETEEIAAISRDQNDPDYVPWYLRETSSTPPAARHTLPGQDMPDLPDHAPELLKPIVSHVLDSFGLTFLEVLDLRSVSDPPPALGSNLIMVVATARSERHLHASADKFCRWLRTEHNLTPYADGLLGRNEMKIAIRRRVRRAKMMSAVGAGGGSEGDIADGIRSGWICVHVGRVEGGLLPETEPMQSPEQVTGFGTSSNATTLVVQMMTEEKRQELQLEELWRETKRRQDTRRNSLASDEADLDDDLPVDALSSIDNASHTSTAPVFGGTTYTPSGTLSNVRRHAPMF